MSIHAGERCQKETETEENSTNSSSSKCSVKCANNATCTEEKSGKILCHCQPGFKGDRCELCDSNSVCQNGGQCEAGLGRCNCAPGFHGPLCQVRQCDSYGSCLNGGTCIGDLKGPYCQCKPTFTGKVQVF